MAEVPKITVDELVARHEVLLLDAYGVLLDSSGALPGAVELIDRLNRTGRPYHILTNDSSRLPATSADRLPVIRAGHRRRAHRLLGVADRTLLPVPLPCRRQVRGARDRG